MTQLTQMSLRLASRTSSIAASSHLTAQTMQARSAKSGLASIMSSSTLRWCTYLTELRIQSSTLGLETSAQSASQTSLTQTPAAMAWDVSKQDFYGRKTSSATFLTALPTTTNGLSMTASMTESLLGAKRIRNLKLMSKASKTCLLQSNWHEDCSCELPIVKKLDFTIFTDSPSCLCYVDLHKAEA